MDRIIIENSGGHGIKMKIKTITSVISDCSWGCFALDKKPFRLENCRERFAVRWTSRTKGFFFSNEANGEDVAAFLLKTEEILRLRDKSEFALTNYKKILWVEPARFWKSCRMRRSLFTCLLRAGVAYGRERDNYESALFSERYLRKSEPAIKRFLYGYTKYVGDMPSGSNTLETAGWNFHFSGKDVKFVKDKLVRPRRKLRPITPDVLKEELWA